ncbi:MAG: hypothetical protein KGH87_09375, partial [Thaumarchaeota archaeon]|nr:hypothetical protein [Nitrososphaerota archaeon]
MADSLAELIRDPAYVTMDPHERMKSFFDTAAKDALFQYSRPEVQRETARRILSGTAHHALSQIAEDAGPALDVMDDPRFAAAGTG